MHSEDRAEWRETDEWVVPTPTLKPGDRVAVADGDTTFNFTIPAHAITQEPDMPDQRRHDELVALLNKISEESVSASDVLADVLDLLRERLPGRAEVKVAPFDPDLAARNLDAIKHELETPMGEHGECCEPAPAGDPPGEPVEPGDLRAGDRVAFTWVGTGERIACILVSEPPGRTLRSDTLDRTGYDPYVVVRGREWCAGISDVRLIERAPREDEDEDEALAKACYSAEHPSGYGHDTWPPQHPADRAWWFNIARAAREHIEGEMGKCYAKEDATAHDRAERAEAERDKWKALATKAEAERDQAYRFRDAMRDARDEAEARADEVDAAHTPQADPDTERGQA